jgi:hypothetical protein
MDLLEDKHLVSRSLIIEDGGLHNGAFHIRITELNLPFGVNQQDFVELNGLIFRRGKAVAEDLFSSLDFELLACNVNNCVHKKQNLFKFQPEAPVTATGLPEPPGHKMDGKYNYFLRESKILV